MRRIVCSCCGAIEYLSVAAEPVFLPYTCNTCKIKQIFNDKKQVQR